jgi:hypothetical protein
VASLRWLKLSPQKADQLTRNRAILVYLGDDDENESKRL